MESTTTCPEPGAAEGQNRTYGGVISIIVPVYNTEKYLARCVNSLLAQTCPSLEILLVDDGSTDGSGALCDRFAAVDKRVVALHKKNGGSSSARNLGIARARGEYIGFVDSDDFVDRDMYRKLLEALRSRKVNTAQIGRDEIAPDGSILPDICVSPEKPEVISPEKFMEELLMHRGDCSFCTKLFRAEALRGLPEIGNIPGGGKSSEGLEASPDRGKSSEGLEASPDRDAVREYFPTGVLNEDFNLLVRMLDRLGPVVSLPGHAYHVFYRLGSNSRKESRDSFSRVYADSVDNADLAAAIVAEKYPQLKDIAFRFGIFQRLEYLLHIPVSRMTEDNGEYRRIVGYLRKNWLRSMRNPVLTGKNKVYHSLFALAPRTVRRLHRILRGRKAFGLTFRRR